MPFYLRSYVNRVLDQSHYFDGRVGTVRVHLWRGAYSIDDVKIVSTTNTVPVPFFEGKRVDVSLDWGALWRGRFRGRVALERPRLHFVHGPTDEETQTGADQPWLSMINDLFPFRIDRAEVTDGEIHFHAFHTHPPVHAHLADVQATVENLTNVQDSLDPLIASVHARGVAMGSGRLQFDMTLDPQAHRPSFELATLLVDLDVKRLNALALAYGDFDFEEGRFDLVVELSAKDGFIQGYAKPLFRNLRVVSLRDVRTKDPLHLLWESLVGVVGAVFKNQPRNQFGTSITLEGEIDDPRTSILEIVGNVLRNAFVRAYLPKIEGRVAPHATGRESAGARPDKEGAHEDQ